MDKNLLIALIDSLLDDKISDFRNDLPTIKSKKGVKGKPGHPFIWEEHEGEINSLIEKELTAKRDELKLRFDNLSLEEKESLKLKFDNLTSSEKESLRGLKGQKGKTGKNFSYEENREDLEKDLNKIFESSKESLKLKFDDLSEEEKDSLRGFKGQKGKPGKDFSYEENRKDLEQGLNKVVESNKESLKLKFDDLSEEEKESLRGFKGQRGNPGKNFSYEEHKKDLENSLNKIFNSEKDSLKLRFDDLSEEEIKSLRGNKGARGQKGPKGENLDFEECKNEIFGNIKNLFDTEKESLKLKFDDLSEEEKDSLKLKFDNLTEKEVLTLKGDKGARGQKGPRGAEGEKGNVGPMGIPGFPGVMGTKGFSGQDGKDGLDAPVITDIEIRKLRKSKFYFIFHFSNGQKIETDRIDLPDVGKMIVNTTQSSRAALITFWGDTELGRTNDIVFDQELVVEYDSETLTTTVRPDLPEKYEEMNFTGNKIDFIETFNAPAKLTADRRYRTDFTYTGNLLTQEDQLAYEDNGTTERYHIRYTYIYSGNQLIDSQKVII